MRLLEDVGVDQRLVDAWEGLSAPVNAADVCLVVENPEHDGRLPAARRRGRMFSIEATRNRSGAESSSGVPLEDAANDRRGALVRDKLLAIVADVAEGDTSVGPAAFPCPALDAAGHAVNDRGVLKLGEHPEHLQHHPPRRGASVERLGRRAQDHAELVQLLSDPGKLTHLAR
ncbi:MAG: hypothetical protein WB698_04845 [Solirubrobacteraceae bacterium]